MMSEGKERVSAYRVLYYYLNTECLWEVEAHSAQEAVNTLRNQLGNDVKEVIEVWKVVNNWK